MSPNELSERVADALSYARKRGASQAEASASNNTGLTLRVRMREVETLESHQDHSLGVTVYQGKRRGSASTSDLSSGAVRETVDKALSLARFAAEDEYAGLADADRMATEFPGLDLHHPWDLEAEQAMDLALECEAAALDADPRISNSEGAGVDTGESAFAYGNSHGFLQCGRSSSHSLSCVVLGEQDGQMERDYDFSVARAPEELTPAKEVGESAAERTIRRLGARKIGSTKAPVLFAPRVARSLVGHFCAAVSGRALYNRASFLLDSLDKQVFADCVNLNERPHIPRGLASRAYDGEGVATADRDLICGGVLKGYFLGSYSARKLGMATTGNAGGAHNLFLESTGQSYEELLAEMGEGVVVTEMMGQGANTVTGDYSRGAAGYWVRGGAVQHAVHEITVAGNLKDMFRNIAAIGTDVDRRGGIYTGSILIEDLSIAGA
ncbi:MAG: metalloprotease PmbA [Gammaproteobacteria bacterium]|nr:metalloprotease PmbA [Gammaproteobacteria bacterium]MYF66592.1 metalloprotease PmbA [Gammaproteobacteria bacterium]MYK37096.1 metalloprotease PmbA [Gammaproteobacteria bacterium]